MRGSAWWLALTVGAWGLLLLAGCAPKYSPIHTDIPAMESEDAAGDFLTGLILHLAHQRQVPFAVGYMGRSYGLVSRQDTDSGYGVVYTFSALTPRYSPYAYIYFQFGPDTVMEMGRNTSVIELTDGYSDDGDGPMRGVYRLRLAGAAYCHGETDMLPEVEGERVRIRLVDKVIRRSMMGKQEYIYTKPYCQSNAPERGAGEGPTGVRFYFDTEDEMRRFAGKTLAAFPFIRIERPPAR